MTRPLLGTPTGERQGQAGECGLACLATVAQHFGDRTDLATLRRRFPISSRGVTLKGLMNIADELGLHARALQCGLDSLELLTCPAILHWDMNHFVVLERIERLPWGARAVLFDPAKGRLRLRLAELETHFTGIAIELFPGVNFQPAPKRPRLRIDQLWTRIRGLGHALARIFILSAIMQVVALVTPLYMQLAIDTALPAGDLDLLNIIAVGFTSVLIINATVAWMRSRLSINLSNNLGLYMGVNLFRHTLSLPVGWFEKRHLGDIVSRFSSLQPITDLLGRGLVSSLIDGALAISTLVLMFIYSPTLSLVAISAVSLYIIVKLLFFRSMKYANVNVLTAQSIENSNFLENMRGVSTIKLFCQENNRQRIWQNKRVDVINGSIKMGRLTSTFDSINMFVVGAENIVFIYASVMMMISGSISLGMMFAFQAYKQSFVGASTRLVDQVLNYRLAGVHLDRLSDIALEKCENVGSSHNELEIGTIELRNIGFSYGVGLPPVLRGVNLTIRPGEVTVLVGPSGCGKSTLMKIICGLLSPTTGEILVDGQPLKEFGIRAYRERLGVVSQEDTLFSGSIAENISFFDPDYRIDNVRKAAEQSAVAYDIDKMPMKYDTLVGDMGSTLSGGQKQRILLARALYKRPDILVLDEATSHLDIQTEMKVVSALASIGTTRLMVAHRPDTIRIADHVYSVANGIVTRLSVVVSEDA